MIRLKEGDKVLVWFLGIEHEGVVYEKYEHGYKVTLSDGTNLPRCRNIDKSWKKKTKNPATRFWYIIKKLK